MARKTPKDSRAVVRVYVSNLRKRSIRSPRHAWRRLPPEGRPRGGRSRSLRRASHRRSPLAYRGDFPQAADALGKDCRSGAGRRCRISPTRHSPSPRSRARGASPGDTRGSIRCPASVGCDSELVADLEQLVEADPLRERLRAQLMLALYRWTPGRRAGRVPARPPTPRRRARARAGETLRGSRRRSCSRIPSSTGRACRGALWGPAWRRPVSPLDGDRHRSGAPGDRRNRSAPDRHDNRLRPQRPSVARLRVALVREAPRSVTDASPTADGVRAAADDLGFRTKILYGGHALSGFLRAIASAARTSDLVVVDATPHLEAVSRLTRRFPRPVPRARLRLRQASVLRWAAKRDGLQVNDREDGYLGGYLAGLMTHGDEAVSRWRHQDEDRTRPDWRLRGRSAACAPGNPGARRLHGHVRHAEPLRGRSEPTDQPRLGSGHDVAGICGFGALEARGSGVSGPRRRQRPLVPRPAVPRLGRQPLRPRHPARRHAFRIGATPGGRVFRLDLASDGIGLVGINNRVPAVRLKVEKVAARLRAADQSRDAR